MPADLFGPEASLDQTKRTAVWLHNGMQLYILTEKRIKSLTAVV